MKGFEVTKGIDIIDGLKAHRDNYNDRGKYLGFESLHNHYSMQLGTCTDWTGYPRSGKTQILMELLLNTSKYYGWKHLVYFPDVGNNIEIVADLMHKLTGKTFNPKYSNTISDNEIVRNLEWICHHFKILTKTDVKAKMNPFQFWDYAVKLKAEEGLQTASIDSWKDMAHDYKTYGSPTVYLETVLPYRNHIAEEHNLHLHTVIHPKLTEKENGVRKPPTPYDLKHGSEWVNSGKCMITIHRTDALGIEADMIFHKMKPRSVGEVGMIKLQFDIAKLVYYTENEYMEKIYSQPRGETTNELPKPQGNPVISWHEKDDSLPF